MGLEPILAVKVPVIIDTMLNFIGQNIGLNLKLIGVGTCDQGINSIICLVCYINLGGTCRNTFERYTEHTDPSAQRSSADISEVFVVVWRAGIAHSQTSCQVRETSSFF